MPLSSSGSSWNEFPAFDGIIDTLRHPPPLNMLRKPSARQFRPKVDTSLQWQSTPVTGLGLWSGFPVPAYVGKGGRALPGSWEVRAAAPRSMTPVRPGTSCHDDARVRPTDCSKPAALTTISNFGARSRGPVARCLRFVPYGFPAGPQDSLPAGG